MIEGTADTVMLTKEPIRKTWWELSLSSPVGDMPRDCQYRIRNLPELRDSSEAKQYVMFNSAVTYPGQRQSVSATIQLLLYEQDELYDFFKAWRKLVHNEEDDMVGLYRDVVGQGNLKLYAPGENGNDNPKEVYNIKLVDVWPSAFLIGDFSRDMDGEAQNYSVTLEIAEYLA